MQQVLFSHPLQVQSGNIWVLPIKCFQGVDNLIVRMVYSKPLLIVYGTGSTDSEILREVYQTAVYLANQNAAAHSTFISLHTDEEYFLISKQTRKNSNVIFIGGLTINKAMRWNARILHEETNITSAVKFEVGEGFTVTGSGNVVSDQDSSLAIVFTLPTRDHSVAVCIHAASFMGYRHLSRLLWPTVPPMVSFVLLFVESESLISTNRFAPPSQFICLISSS